MMVAVTGADPVLFAMNGAILPVPLDGKPIVALLFVQPCVVRPTPKPAVFPVKLMAAVFALHTYSLIAHSINRWSWINCNCKCSRYTSTCNSCIRIRRCYCNSGYNRSTTCINCCK
jgi:hypothetical protein